MIIQTDSLCFIGETETREVVFPFSQKTQLVLKSKFPPLAIMFFVTQSFTSASVIPSFWEMLEAKSVVMSSPALYISSVCIIGKEIHRQCSPG